jgi:hypothetical protein
MAIVLLTAMFTVYLQYGFSSIKLLAKTAAGAQLGRRAMKPICCILRAFLHSCWEDPVLFRSIVF